MNKKIYFNDKFILLTPHRQHFEDMAGDQYKSVTDATLKKISQDLTDPGHNKNIFIETKDFEKILEKLKDHFYYIEAAGGFIENAGKFLFIHRHGRWDLPKGKLEKREEREHAAIRECEEECGVKDLRIRSQLSSTFHVYPYKKGHALKQTFWYYMDTDFSGDLLPQLEEDIHQVKWFGRKEIATTILTDTYYTISDVVNEGLNVTG